MKASEDKNLFSVIATPVLIIDVIAVFLFYLGWTYTYYLYYDFGVNVGALNIPLYYFFIYALPVVYGNAFYFSLALLIPTAVILLIKISNLRFKFPDWLPGQSLLTVVIAVSLIVMLPLSDLLARSFARKTAVDMRNGNAKTVNFKFRDDPTALFPPRFLKANDEGDLRLLLQTNDRFIVFLQPEPDEGMAELPRGSTFVVFNSDIRLANITLDNVIQLK